MANDPPASSSSSPSSLFPNRPIRPLPKRRLRERLSPEVADSIQYPSPPPSSAPLFQYPPLAEEHSDHGFAPTRETGSPPEHRQSRKDGTRVEDGLGTAVAGPGPASRAAQQHANLVARPKSEHGRYAESLPVASATSSADGYDPFENTNNKKRKIPTAGDSAPSGVHAVHDSTTVAGSLAAGGQPGEGLGEASAATSGSNHGPGGVISSAHNVAGPGRGRYGRPRSGKNPLRPLYDSTNSWAGRFNRPRSGQGAPGTSESTGIISNAIANAGKLAPQQGQENISLLHQQSAPKRNPASAQFTFTCDSQVPGSLAWPGSDHRAGVPPHQAAAAGHNKENWPGAPQGTQTGQSPPATPQGVGAGASQAGPSGQGQPGAPHPKTTRRSAAKELLAVARARRRETQLRNKRDPPKPEDIWICHFCEYEAIFGRPPEALVRQYELKERKQRQQEEQRRAQWERMKKGKHKGKRASKLPAKNPGGAAAQHDVHQHHHGADDHHGGAAAGDDHHGAHGGGEEEYYDEEYYEDEEYDPEDELPLDRSTGVHGPHDHHHHHHNHNDVPAHQGGSAAFHDGGGT